MTPDVVLLVTASYDRAADQVEQCINELGRPSFRLDTDLFPTAIKATYHPDTGVSFISPKGTVNSTQIMSVWYRRNVAPALPADMDKYSREFSERESRAFLEGAITSIQTSRWLSYPPAIWRAERKLYQLAIASQLGFQVPPTLVTNDQAATRHFSSKFPLIAKAISSGYIDSPLGYKAIFTTALHGSDLQDLTGLDLAPVTFQERIEKVSDIRVTVVGEELFAAEILSQEHPSSFTDWRATVNPDVGHRVYDLPSKQQELCKALVRKLGLQYGAIDLALTEDQRHVFFEINPNGEWLWLEDKLGFPISKKISQWLLS